MRGQHVLVGSQHQALLEAQAEGLHQPQRRGGVPIVSFHLADHRAGIQAWARQVFSTVVAHAAVVDMLLDEESVHLAGLGEFIGKPISLSAEPGMGPEQYDIVPM